MSFNIEQIKIELLLNSGQQPVTLKSSIIELSDLKKKPIGLNDYPYFTIDVEYPTNKLYNLQTEDLLLFFFNKDKFTEYLTAYVDESEIKKSVENDYTYYENKKTRIEHNVMVMLQLLLPTRFPVYNDLRKSHDYIFNPANAAKFWIDPMILFWNRFSYLNVNGKKYTCKKIIWINDIFNHPRYRDLLDYYRKFIVWHKEQLEYFKKRGMDEEKENKEKIKKSMQNIIDTIYGLLEDYISNIPDLTRKGGDVVKAEDRKKFTLTKEFKKVLEDLFTQIIKLENQGYILQVDIESSIPQIKKLVNKIKTYDFTETNKNTSTNDLFNKNIILFGDHINAFIKHLNDNKKILRNIGFSYNKKSPTFRKETFTETVTNELSSIKRWANSVPSLDNKYNLTSMYLTKTYEEIKAYVSKPENNNLSISSEYINFNLNELKRYRRPFRISTNYKLQNLINGKTNETITEFYEKMDPIYEYMRVGSFGEHTNLAELVELCNVGLCEINTNELRGVRREIQVYLDLIEGEINDKNVNSVFCPFVGDHLGNEVEYLLRLSNIGKSPRDKWNIFRNRMLFSLKNMNSNHSNAEPRKEVIGKLINEPNIEQYGQTEKGRDANYVENQFMKEIVYKNTSRLNELLNKIIETCSFAGEGINVGLTDLFPFIVKQNDDLYKILQKWSQNESYKNRDIIEQMNVFRGIVTSRKATIVDKLDSINAPPEYKLKMNCSLAKIELYIFLIDELLKHENAKQQNTGYVFLYQGGSKRKTNRKNSRRSVTKKIRK